MENQPKLNSSKEVIAFLAERFPHCFSAEGEARPLKIGIFQDLVDRVAGEMNLSKTQLRSALRLYTSSWRYLYGVKPGATRVDLDGNPCGELDEQHVEHARKQLEEAKARVQAQRAEQQAKKREAAALAPALRPAFRFDYQIRLKGRIWFLISSHFVLPIIGGNASSRVPTPKTAPPKRSHHPKNDTPKTTDTNTQGASSRGRPLP